MDAGKVLCDAGVIDEEQYSQVMGYHKDTGGNIVYLTVKLKLAEEEDILLALGAESGMTINYLEGVKLDEELVDIFPRELLEKNIAVPLSRSSGGLQLGICDPYGDEFLDEMRMIAGQVIEPVLVSPMRALEVLEKYYASHEKMIRPTVASEKSRSVCRESVNNLVNELEVEITEGGRGDNLYSLETREILFSLIKALERKGIINAAEIEQQTLE